MKVILVFLCAVAISQQISIGDDKPSQRIWNGGLATPYSIPYSIFLWIFPPLGNVDRYACGGVVITPTFVLTSAQCVSRISMATVYAGVDNAFDYKNGSQFRNLRRAGGIIHERFNPRTLENNIGLVQIDALELNDRVALAKLPVASDGNQTFLGAQGRLSGWSTGRYNHPNRLMQVNNTVISNNECNSVYQDIRDYEICLSGAGARRACYNDEGGPLVIGNTVQGIISYRDVPCDSENPTVSTRIAPYLSWIQANSDWKP